MTATQRAVEAAAPPVPVDLVRDEVTVDGLSLAYSSFGSGVPLVWLHGSGPGASGLSNFASNLPSFAGFHNLVFDLPRFGDSSKPDISEPLVPHAARHLVNALDALAIERAHVIGNSYGGLVGIRMAAERPSVIDQLVVMGAGAIPPELTEWPAGLQLAFRYMGRSEPSRADLEQLVRAMVVDQSLVTDALIDERLQASRRAHPEIPVPPNYGDVNPDLPRVRARTLLLWGREDRFVPLEWALRTLRGIPEAELRVLPHCGHWVQYEQRDLFDRIVLDFLGGDR